MSESKIVALAGSGAMTPAQIRALHEMDATIRQAINDAQEAGAQMGLIVAILHGYAHMMTAQMIRD